MWELRGNDRKDFFNELKSHIFRAADDFGPDPEKKKRFYFSLASAVLAYMEGKRAVGIAAEIENFFLDVLLPGIVRFSIDKEELDYLIGLTLELIVSFFIVMPLGNQVKEKQNWAPIQVFPQQFRQKNDLPESPQK